MHQRGEGDSEFIDGRRNILALVFNLVERLLGAEDAGLALLPRLQVNHAAAMSVVGVGCGRGVGRWRGRGSGRGMGPLVSTNLR